MLLQGGGIVGSMSRAVNENPSLLEDPIFWVFALIAIAFIVYLNVRKN